MLGWAAAAGTFAFQALALHNGPMSEVQPVLVSELVFVLVLRRIWIRQQVTAAAWASALAVCLVLAVFLIAAEPTGGRTVPQTKQWLSAGLVFGGTIAVLTVLGRAGPPMRRAAVFAAAAGLTWALEATLLKAATDTFTAFGIAGMLTRWPVYALIVVRRPHDSLEVVNVAGDSAVGRGRIQSAPNLRRVHAESAQQHRRRIWWLENEDLGQHLLGRDLEPPTVGLRRFLKHFLCRGRHAEAIFLHDVSERRLLRHGAHRQWGSVGAGPQAQGAQGFLIERLKGLAGLLQAHAQHDFDRGILQQGEQKVIAELAPITSCSPCSRIPRSKSCWA